MAYVVDLILFHDCKMAEALAKELKEVLTVVKRSETSMTEKLDVLSSHVHTK